MPPFFRKSRAKYIYVCSFGKGISSGGVVHFYRICSNIKKGVAFSNTAQYCNKEVDELFAKAETAPDEERTALYAQIQKILAEDIPVLWLYGQKHDFFFDKRVRDAMTTAHGVAGSYARAWLAEQ